MSPPQEPRAALTKLALKRADLFEMVTTDDWLRTTPFIKALGTLADSVLKQGTARRYPNLVPVFQLGEPGTSLFFVLKGEVRLSGRKGTESVEVGTAARGEVFGEEEVLSGVALRTGFAVAQGEVDVAELPRVALLQRGELLREVSSFLTPIKAARQAALHEMTDFMNRW